MLLGGSPCIQIAGEHDSGCRFRDAIREKHIVATYMGWNRGKLDLLPIPLAQGERPVCDNVLNQASAEILDLVLHCEPERPSNE